MEYRPLGSTGADVSILGFGTAPLGGEYQAFDEAEAIRAVHCAIDRGITFFDSSPYYGRTRSEERLGRALEDGRRDKIFLATKCGRSDVDAFDFTADRVRSSIDESLRRLHTDHLDLYQLHDIEFWPKERIVDEALPALLEVKASGKARFVGITGLPIRHLRDVAAHAPIDTILAYCHYNLLVRDLDDVLVPFCDEHDIGLVNASPLHMGVLSPHGAPEWHPASDEVKEVGHRLFHRCHTMGQRLVDVALRFALDHEKIATTVCGMLTVDEVEQNLRAMEMETDLALIAELDVMIEPVRDANWTAGLPENNP